MLLTQWSQDTEAQSWRSIFNHLPQNTGNSPALNLSAFYALQMQPRDLTTLVWFFPLFFIKFMAASSPLPKKGVHLSMWKSRMCCLSWMKTKTPNLLRQKCSLEDSFKKKKKKIFFLIIHLFFLSGSCKTRTSDVVISVLCRKLAEILDLRKIKQSTPECNETLHCNGKGKILHMIFFSTPGQISQLLNLHYI